jgi:hypothetical protein
MGWKQRRPIPYGKACSGCGERWAQGRTGLCATCQTDQRPRLELERAKVEAEAQQLASLRSVQAMAPHTRPVRTIDGREFEVVWDGTRS